MFQFGVLEEGVSVLLHRYFCAINEQGDLSASNKYF